MEKIVGLYGGTFDPPHLAHLGVARAFLKEFPQARLVIMPCLIPPHKTRKTGGAEADQRLEMSRACFGALPRTSVDDYELTKEGTSYTYLTVNHLQDLYGDARICIVMGQDNLEIMESWREYRYLLDTCIIAVAVRGDEALSPIIDGLREKYGADIRILHTEKSPLSSTEVRRLVSLGLPCDHAVTKEVANYISREGLYSMTETVIPIKEIYAYISGLSPRRLSHTYGVEKAAIMLANNHYPTLDKRIVSAAALLHDCTKEKDAEGHREIAKKYGAVFDETTASTVKLQHAVTGAAVAEKEFLLPEAALAILTHTTAAANMNPLQKIIYMADFIEENRKDELCLSVRQYYFNSLKEDKTRALDKTLLFALEESIKLLRQECKNVHPHTLEARNFIKECLADEDNNRGSKQ